MILLTQFCKLLTRVATPSGGGDVLQVPQWHDASDLVRLKYFIREAFIQRQHAVAVFFDLEKAYDCTWKYGIMKDLHQAGLCGRLPCFIEGFLKIDSFQSA